jgi:hypothetical protein
MGNAVLPLVAITNGVTGQHNITEETIAPAGEERATGMVCPLLG